MYRRQAVFGAGYRVRISVSRRGPEYRWFNSHPAGGDPSLENFQSWATRTWRRDLVHPRDADAWKTAFIDVEGGGRGQLVVSAADDTWRAILCWGSAGRRIEIDHEGIPASLSNLQLNIASFGHRVVRYEPLTTFGMTWKKRLPGACLAVLVADAWRDCQLDLLIRERRRFGFRDVNPITGSFINSTGGGRQKGGATTPLRNASDGGNYFQNLFPVLLGRDVGSEEFGMWLAGVSEPPARKLRDLEKWLIKTKANVVVWSYRGSGDHVLGPIDKKTDLRPRGLHVGVREGDVYRLELDGPWCNRFGSSLDVAIEHSVRTQRRFRRTAEAIEEKEEPDTTECGSKAFTCVTDIVSDLMAINKSEVEDGPQQAARKKRKRGKTSEFNMWYAPPGTALEELMLHLHLVGVSCRGRLSSYSHWDSLSVPAHVTRLIELHNELGLQFSHGVLDFRVSSQYSQSLLALLKVCWRGPIVGAEEVSGTSYGPEDWQCDINGAHTAALMSMAVVPVFGHVDEVEEYHDHDIEDWTLYKIELDALGKPDELLNADVTPVFGRNYKRYLDLVDTAARHRVTHFVRPSRIVSMCHIPTLAKDLLAHELGDRLLQDADCARKFKKGTFVRASGMLQQRYADRIDAVMVTGCDEAFAVGGKIVPVLGEVDRVKDELRTGQEKLGIESLRTGDTYLCLDAEQTWNALESCGTSDFSYQCDAVFFRGSSSVQEKMRLRFSDLIRYDERRVLGGIKAKISLDALSPAMRRIPCPPKHCLRVIPLWDGIGGGFSSMEYVHDVWRSLEKNAKRNLWPEIGEAEKVFSAPTCSNKSYCATRAATAIFKTGLVLTPTSILRTAFTDMPCGWSVKTADHQLGFSLGNGSHVRKTAGSIRTLKVDVIIIEEAAYMPLRTLSMILAAAHSSGTHVIGTYDTHQLQPVCDSSGMSISKANVDRRVILEKAFPICFHVFARKRDKTVEEQVEMDDGLLYILAAGDDSHEAQTRAIERFGGEFPTASDPSPSDFHLAYTRDCARFHAFRGLLGCDEAGGWDGLGRQTVVGAQYRDLGNLGKVHKNHTYDIIRSSADEVLVASVFDGTVSLEETSLCRAEAENLFDPPGSCTVHAVQGRTVEGKLIIHQARHPHADVHWLYTAVSRATGPSNVRVIDDIHRSESNMFDRERVSWVSRKVSSYIYVDVTAGRLGPEQGGRHREALVQELLNSYGSGCNLCTCELVWAVYSERQPTLDRLLAAPHRGKCGREVPKVREVWIQNFGAGHNAGPVKIEIRQLLVLIKKESSTAKKSKMRKGCLKQLQTAWDRVVSFGKFGKLDLPRKWSARRAIHSRKVSFTGLADIDDLLRKVRLLPPYVSRLELTPEEKSMPKIKRQESLEVKCRRGLTVHASDLIDTMESIIRYARPKCFELACALSFVSGRGLAELAGNTNFSPGTCGPCESEVKMGALTRVLLLCEYDHFIEGLKRLRGMKDTSCLTAAEINQRYSKSANIAARKLLPTDGGWHVFGDL
ncbi:unnamed protein product [Ectocarpus sp. CCAP 1310/34]|nr:unnamed protein product [Ectocarpus sp. CCAP 1310/34]